MVVAVWSVKGGVGATSVAALLALAQAAHAHDTLLVDLCGDVPTLLGTDEAADGLGIVDWCALGRPDAEALARVEIDARPSLRYLPRGHGEFPARPTQLMDVLMSSRRTVIIDCGFLGENRTFHEQVVQSASRSVLVMRECFLNLRAVQQQSITPSGVIVVKEEQRQLGRADVEAVTGAPVIAQIAFDPTVARSIDAGLARGRPPRSLLRRLGRVLTDAA